MSREIKFRAWSTISQEWVDFTDIDYRFGLCDTGELEGYYVDSEGSPNHSEIVFMQYTGLKDKNGVEIYEGDIVEYTYQDGYAKKRKVVEYSYRRQYTGFNIGAPENYEVIGNICENPELIK